MRIVYSILLFFLFSAYLSAEEAPKIPLITVTGTHELNVAPDQIKIAVNIDNREKLLQEAKAKTDLQVKKLAELAKANQISTGDVIPSYLAISPVRNSRKNEGKDISYFGAWQSVIITLKDFSKYDLLMDAIVKEGFGKVFVEYDLADMPSYRKQARVKAILAAQEKAKMLAEAVGQKIGKAYAIKEINQSSQSDISMLTSNSLSFAGNREDEETRVGPLSIGNIEIKVTVEASFYLE